MDIDREQFKTAFIDRLQSISGTSLEEAAMADKYAALASLIKDYIGKRWVNSNKAYYAKGDKQVYYFSIEFLLGRLLETNLYNLGIRDQWVDALAELGIKFSDLEQEEHDAGLGNGGLGRLAACFLDSLASLQLAGHGCGIRYKYGLFEQKIIDGQQIERPDNWLKNAYAWEYRKADKAVEIKFGGQHGTVRAVPYDIPIVGYQNNTVNTLRLWSAEALDSGLDYDSFNQGNYSKAMEYKYSVEAITEILYPDDNHYAGRLLRLKQQYFFVSAGLQSIIRYHKKHAAGVKNLPERVAIHINDTHPALAVPELMRILMDDEGLGWDEAWRITVNTIAYTNHTILPEALEKWPIEIFRDLLPRIYDIVHEINERFCRNLWNVYPGEWERIGKMAIIANGQVHMAHLAIAGSRSVNGVAKIHTEILKKDVLNLFYQFFPNWFSNKTNGITHRRWLLKANPELAKLITSFIGDSWIRHPGDLHLLQSHMGRPVFLKQLMRVKRQRKILLAKYIKEHYNIDVDINSIFDIHVKRIHAYKRQLLNVLRIMELYNRLKANPDLDIVPRTFIFAGKAAPGYLLAKKIIQLINAIAAVVNNDKTIRNKIKVVFMENYSVSLAELIIPAADVSEQISTASKEASGTGNMKFMMNGAITVGTLDGANVEIREEVGDDNIIIFGLTAEQVIEYCQTPICKPSDLCAGSASLTQLLNQLVDGSLPVPKDEFRPIYDYLLHGAGEFFELMDLPSYLEAHAKVDALYRDKEKWFGMVALNIAHAGAFSSDHTVTEYANGIWNMKPARVRILA
jgi:starch phosphorylase